jgi:hypothetical protein
MLVRERVINGITTPLGKTRNAILGFLGIRMCLHAGQAPAAYSLVAKPKRISARPSSRELAWARTYPLAIFGLGPVGYLDQSSTSTVKPN